MISLFKPKKKEEEKVENLTTNLSTTFEQNLIPANVGYSQTAQSYPPQYGTSPYSWSNLNYSVPYQFQGAYESPGRPQEMHGNYVQQQSFQDKQSDYSYDWESYIQSIVEDILKDKLSFINNQFSEIKIWKEKYEIEISKINEKLKDIENRINNMYEILAKKLEEYDKGIKEATVEVEALHRLIRTMVPAISESTKELKETIEEIKQLRDQLKKA